MVLYPRAARLCLVASLLTPQVVPAAQRSQPAPEKTSARKARTEADDWRRKNSLLLVRGFSEQMLSLRDTPAKSWWVAQLADLLWPEQEQFARELFTKALDLAAAKRGESGTDWARLRRKIIALVAARDANWAKRLTDGDSSAEGAGGGAERAESNFHVAYSLLDSQPEQSAEFARRSLTAGLFPLMHTLLIQLRLKNPKVADELFLRTLDQAVAAPAVDADTLLNVGTYLFTSPRIETRDPNITADATFMVGVGGTLLVDITADRPNLSPPLARAYLTAAAKLLARPPSDPEQRLKFYAAGRMLLPKAERYAPELVSHISAAMQALTQDAPAELTQELTYEGLRSPQEKDLSDELKEIEKERDVDARDGRYLSLASDLWRRADFQGARAAGARIDDAEARTDLSTQIAFREAALKLDKENDLQSVEESAGKLPQGLERAALRLGLAHARLEQGDVQRAGESVDDALASARKVNDARRPFLFLTAAGQLARFDPVRAKVVLSDAVRQFNEFRPEELATVEWSQRIEAGYLWRDFPVQVKGVSFDFKHGLRPLVRSDLDVTLAAVRKLAAEEMLAQALLAVAEAVLRGDS